VRPPVGSCSKLTAAEFWWFFPIGFAGIQTLLFFIPAFAIFILRVSQAHFGLRTSPSPAQTIKQLLLSASAWWTIVTYVLFGFFYGEVYMWTAPASADLAWVKEGR
jgi:nucleoporin NDC1